MIKESLFLFFTPMAIKQRRRGLLMKLDQIHFDLTPKLRKMIQQIAHSFVRFLTYL